MADYIKSDMEDGTMTLSLSGRIDSGNAEIIERSINDETAGKDIEKLILDIGELEYLSSAGLRIILRLKKKFKNFSIINANPEVYEIFTITGFVEMMDISKAYRKISIDGCEVIGEGANGRVYRIDPDTIVKVYFNSDALPDIHKERELAKTAFVLGVPTAIPYDVVRVGDSYGSVFELLNAKSLASNIVKDNDSARENVKIFVELLKIIHKTQVNTADMPDMKETALNWILFLKEYLPEETFKKIYKLIGDVSENNHMIHGDYHMKNVMMQNGEAILIDMDTLAYGAPVFEFGSIFNAYVGFGSTDSSEAEKFQGISYELSKSIWKMILEEYFETEEEKILKEYEDKAALIGYTRLMRRLIRRNGFDTEEGRNAIEFYKGNIIRLADRVETLEF